MQPKSRQNEPQLDRLFDMGHIRQELTQSMRDDSNYTNTDNAKKKAAKQCGVIRCGLRTVPADGFGRKPAAVTDKGGPGNVQDDP